MAHDEKLQSEGQTQKTEETISKSPGNSAWPNKVQQKIYIYDSRFITCVIILGN